VATKNLVLYDLADYRSTRNLRTGYRRCDFSLRIQAESSDTAGISRPLNYVYFQTEPMRAAAPGSVLDFSSCRKAIARIFVLLTMLPLRPKAVKRSGNDYVRSSRRVKGGYQAICRGPSMKFTFARWRTRR